MNKEYAIMVHDSIEAMQRNIIFLLNNGWELQGGIAVILLEESVRVFRARYYQAVTKGEMNGTDD